MTLSPHRRELAKNRQEQRTRRRIYADSRRRQQLQIGEMDDPGLPSLMDLNMMVVLNGRERTAHEYGQLFEAAGLRCTGVTQLQAPLGPWSVIEASAI